MSKEPTSESPLAGAPNSPPAGTTPVPLLSAIDVAKPAGANNRLWPATRRGIHVTFTADDDETATATGWDLDSQQPVFTTTLPRTAQKELIEALSTSVKPDITNDTVVVPGTGDNPGPKMKFSLKLGPQK